MASRVKRTKVGRACGRCRRQKLRCDIQRPCTLCLRAGVECQAGDLDQFIPSDPKRHTNKRKRRGSTRERASRRNGPSGDQRLGGESWSSSTLSLVTGVSMTPDKH
ncbi:uncharacterized protein N7469_006617 [Penicillium citrinum]|uniref:Zn(2)-C6 fungal-type domain-containing protein n=2 Tax=Penicillium TaxID=5073 RepID=A0A9W9TKX8_PENCI|nr:uncharacterized protein N7469_006617 [Penicillium citrinum]KAJ5226611.1 hypothetical protein N7469_006617 [Penicillium citrinum]KAJ5569322.1 hypothetical protein N7450_011808 [Penicillium hetheringtonii]